MSAISARMNRCLCLLALCSLGASSIAQAQTVTMDFTATRGWVYLNGGDTLLPVAVVVSNPGSSTSPAQRFLISMPHGINLGNVDHLCTEASDGSTRSLDCTVQGLSPGATRIVDFFIDGPKSLVAGPGFRLSLQAPGANIIQPDAFRASLADGDTRIRGAQLDFLLVRDIDMDFDRNQIPDLDAAILGLSSTTSATDYLSRSATLDLLFLVTPSAKAYLEEHLTRRIAQLVSATNQVFRDSGVAIRFRPVGLAEVGYQRSDSGIGQTLNTLVNGTDPAFVSLLDQVRASGGDLVILLHALEAGSTGSCAAASTVGIGRQGDFQQALHQGRLLTALNVGPDCLSVRHLAAQFAANMGIVPNRADAPDGGTFSWSAGYGVVDGFTTVMARTGSQDFGSAVALERFSDPSIYCQSLVCGVDRGNIAAGADAVHSLNRTRHLVSALSDQVFAPAPEELADLTTVLGDHEADLILTQSALESGAVRNEFTIFQVTLTSQAAVELHDLTLEFRHLEAGAPGTNDLVYRVPVGDCQVFGATLGVVGVLTEGLLQKAGGLSCLIDRLAPGETRSFSYEIQADGTPPSANGFFYYHTEVSINGVLQPESHACLPVYRDFIEAAVGSTVCDTVLGLFPPPPPPTNLDAVPVVTGSRLSVPFIRLWDGSLVSAEFQAVYPGAVELQLVAATTLDPTLLPVVESTYSEFGLLVLRNLVVNQITYDIEALLVPDSTPVTFTSLLITQTSP